MGGVIWAAVGRKPSPSLRPLALATETNTIDICMYNTQPKYTIIIKSLPIICYNFTFIA